MVVCDVVCVLVSVWGCVGVWVYMVYVFLSVCGCMRVSGCVCIGDACG